MATIDTFSIANFSDNNILAESQLAADILSLPSIAATLLNSADFTGSNVIAVINPGKGTGELQKVNSITSQQLNLAGNLLLEHRKGERVIKAYGNQINVYKAPDVNGLPPALSTYVLAGSVAIDPTTGDSYFTDSNGGTAFWYIFTYENTFSGAETDKSLAEPVRGGGYGQYCSLEEIKDEAGTEDVKRLPDWKIAVRRQTAKSEVDGKLVSAGYTLPLQTQAGVTYTPEIVKQINILLAAGFVLQKNFGVTRPGSSKNGDDKVKEARQMLAEIQLNDTVLVDSTGQPLLKTQLVDGWPDDTTQATQPGDLSPTTGPIFTMDKVF